MPFRDQAWPSLLVGFADRGAPRRAPVDSTLSSARGQRAGGRASSPAEPAEHLHGLGGLGTARVVGIGVDGPDGPVAVDDEAGGNGQTPRAVAVALGQVDPELRVD